MKNNIFNKADIDKNDSFIFKKDYDNNNKNKENINTDEFNE